MKHLWLAGFLAVGLPCVAAAQDRRVHPGSVEVPLSVLPVAVDQTEARSVTSLRDSLRQPWDEIAEKPFRLSSEERQRMREQLRTQSSARIVPKN
jgi:hypothetical protein